MIIILLINFIKNKLIRIKSVEIIKIHFNKNHFCIEMEKKLFVKPHCKVTWSVN